MLIVRRTLRACERHKFGPFLFLTFIFQSMADHQHPLSINFLAHLHHSLPVAGPSTLKRRASPSFGDMEARKRPREEATQVADEDLPVASSGSTQVAALGAIDGARLADDLLEELQCACCSALVYRPVLVSPCQHFFCGSCCVSWIRNGGTNCPACRGVSNAVTPFRAIQPILDMLLRAAPHMARSERERIQADELYENGKSMRIPLPREASPEPNLNHSTEYVLPCPHCAPGNQYGWRCPQPIADPGADLDHAWPLDDGCPPGHQHCGNCEDLLATMAPSTSKCDLCLVYFCGIGVQGRCQAVPLAAQHPHEMSDVGDLLMSRELYDAFDENTVEVDIMLDYMTAQGLTPRHVYREIITHIQSQPDGFKPLIEMELFMDIHGTGVVQDTDPDAPKNLICRLCAREVLLWGIGDWWVRERQKGFLEEHVMARKDCPDGAQCGHQKDPAHAKEFNHIIAPPPSNAEEPAPPLVEGHHVDPVGQTRVAANDGLGGFALNDVPLDF
ncbi:hypothetical protein HGRIS_006255 [Hohenbuehelia grisea]|uniref:RING-type domain-containing protein n=1 Tax=Hohenbuehelia grisea TaxID=104357 RepID=A0ABR3K0N4_9AGAR